MLHIVNLHAARRALQQDGARVLGEGDSAAENHEGDEHARCRVRVEACVALGLPNHDGGDNNADVIDCVANDMNQNSHHAQIMPRLFKLGHIVTVLRVRLEGLCLLVSRLPILFLVC